MSINVREEIKKASKFKNNDKKLLLGRRIEQGIKVNLAENVDRLCNVSDIMSEGFDIFNAGIEGTISVKVNNVAHKIPVRRRPLGKNKEGEIEFQYYAFLENNGEKIELDLSYVKTNIGIKANKEKFEVTRSEMFYKREKIIDQSLPNELCLDNIIGLENNFEKIMLLSKRRSELQKKIWRLEETIKTSNAISYQAKELKRTPSHIANIEQLFYMKAQRDDTIVEIRNVESLIQKEESQTSRFMHAALNVLSAENLELISKKIK